jgi:hypothetical protein
LSGLISIKITRTEVLYWSRHPEVGHGLCKSDGRDDARETRRAISDAIPLLQTADDVVRAGIATSGEAADEASQIETSQGGRLAGPNSDSEKLAAAKREEASSRRGLARLVSAGRRFEELEQQASALEAEAAVL